MCTPLGRWEAFNFTDDPTKLSKQTAFTIDELQRISEDLFQKVVHANKDTEFGKKRNFESLSSLEEFRKQVPLTTYRDYLPCIRRIQLENAHNLLSKSRVMALHKSTGTSRLGGKKFPVTIASLQATARAIKSFTENESKTWSELWGDIEPGKTLAIGSIPYVPPEPEEDDMIAKFKKKSRRYRTSREERVSEEKKAAERTDVKQKKRLKGIPSASESSFNFRQTLQKEKYPFSSPNVVYTKLRTATYEQILHIHLLFALRTKDIRSIQAEYITNVLDLCQILKSDWKLLLKELSTGKIQISIDKDAKTEIQKEFRKSPKRAEELSHILSDIDSPTSDSSSSDYHINLIWPSLALIKCRYSGDVEQYLPQLRKYCHPNVKLFDEKFSTAEGLFGLNYSPENESPEFRLVLNTAIYEFLPAQSIHEKQPDTLLMDEIKEGQDYELVVSTLSGLYRYRTGDMIKITSTTPPSFRFRYKLDQVSNLMGEGITYLHLKQLIEELAAGLKHGKDGIINFTSSLDRSAQQLRYMIWVQLETDDEISTEVDDAVDKILADINPEYKKFRELKLFSRLKVERVHASTFAKLFGFIEFFCDINREEQKLPKYITRDDFLKILWSK